MTITALDRFRLTLTKRPQLFLNKLGFKARIFVSFFLLSVPLLLGISFVFYLYLEDGVKQRTVKEIQKTISESILHMELMIEDTENLSRSILFNDAVQDALHDFLSGDSLTSLSAVSSFVNSSLAYRDFIDSIVVTAGGDVFFSTESATIDISSLAGLKKKWWFDSVDPKEFPYQWIAKSREEQFDFLSKDNRAMLVRKITSKRDFVTTLGVMMIYLDGGYLDSFLQGIPMGKDSDIWIVDENRQVIFQRNSAGKNRELLAAALQDERFDNEEVHSGMVRFQGREYVAAWSRFDHKDWSIVGAVPFSEVNQNLVVMEQQITIMIALFVLVAVLVAFAISASISFPIKYLAEAMDRFDGGGTEAMDPAVLQRFRNRQDEVGSIFHAYDEMRSRIEILIKDIYLKDVEKQKAELAALESQINPHFLYNTLDSINWMAMAAGQSKISEMVTALSDTFRLSLRKTSSPSIELSDEILHVRSYLAIQQHRYGSRLQCRFSIADEVAGLAILRFVIQPLVENALEHGVDRLEGPAHVDLLVFLKGDSLVVEVVNDGAGIDLEATGRILLGGSGEGETGEPKSFYGIRNIHSRVQLAHGPGFGLAYSIRDGRTVCRLTLPVLRGKGGA